MVANSHWLSVEQVAEYLGISKETVYRWLEKGKVPAHRVGKLWRFDTQEIDSWVKAGGAGRNPTSSVEQNLK